jgi:hypothetical protein
MGTQYIFVIWDINTAMGKRCPENSMNSRERFEGAWPYSQGFYLHISPYSDNHFMCNLTVLHSLKQGWKKHPTAFSFWITFAPELIIVCIWLGQECLRLRATVFL